jgi:hypothetical protein
MMNMSINQRTDSAFVYLSISVFACLRACVHAHCVYKLRFLRARAQGKESERERERGGE